MKTKKKKFSGKGGVAATLVTKEELDEMWGGGGENSNSERQTQEGFDGAEKLFRKQQKGLWGGTWSVTRLRFARKSEGLRSQLKEGSQTLLS